ncbi:hypothetical protein KIN20_014220 [Parelaphostrongylus tenuis]|uniref:Uncharacterized protein n=1 Tax=Parelaphostrongylus tenuis TaxID=148309 RepID=A0AAD5QN69_PARTN|nr:hypothetical protein KIN20_014220 [Parelaphostrongylus tenuis]
MAGKACACQSLYLLELRNAPGGFVFAVSDETRIRRFIILGTTGTYYSSEKELTMYNVNALIDFIERVNQNADSNVPSNHCGTYSWPDMSKCKPYCTPSCRLTPSLSACVDETNDVYPVAKMLAKTIIETGK